MTNSNDWREERLQERSTQDDRGQRRDYGPGRSSRSGYTADQDRYGSDAAGGSNRQDWNEDRAFGHGGGYDPYTRAGADSRSGFGERGADETRYGASRYSGSERGGYSGDYGNRYENREAGGALLHQGYRAPFGDRSGFDRNDFHRPDGEGQRYQYNNYQPVYDRPGRYAQGTSYSGPSYGRGGQSQERGFWDQTRDEVSSWFGDDEAARRRQLDDAQHHRGRGPKGYTRSDDRIKEDINDRLTDDYRLDASDIDVKVSGGEVTLDGHVQRREDKRRAEDLAETIGGVKHVQNNLRVKDAAAAQTTLTANTPATATASTARSTN